MYGMGTGVLMGIGTFGIINVGLTSMKGADVGATGARVGKFVVGFVVGGFVGSTGALVGRATGSFVGSKRTGLPMGAPPASVGGSTSTTGAFVGPPESTFVIFVSILVGTIVGTSVIGFSVGGFGTTTTTALVG